jgi:hypothetical protein
MIKRIEFGPAEPSGVESQVAAARAAGQAPPGARPLRVAICTSLPEVLAGPPHALITMGWFRDQRHLDAYETWRASTGPAAGGPVIIAEEVVMRGRDWLAGRWQGGGPKLKHMALARRAAGLTPAEFSARWRGRAGLVGGPGGGAVVIPDQARGLAYVQNHPLASTPQPQPYDAVNEVYFDDEGSVRTRIEWFDRHLPDSREEGLVDQAWFVAAREDVIWDEGGQAG